MFQWIIRTFPLIQFFLFSCMFAQEGGGSEDPPADPPEDPPADPPGDDPPEDPPEDPKDFTSVQYLKLLNENKKYRKRAQTAEQAAKDKADKELVDQNNHKARVEVFKTENEALKKENAKFKEAAEKVETAKKKELKEVLKTVSKEDKVLVEASGDTDTQLMLARRLTTKPVKAPRWSPNNKDTDRGEPRHRKFKYKDSG